MLMTKLWLHRTLGVNNGKLNKKQAPVPPHEFSNICTHHSHEPTIERRKVNLAVKLDNILGGCTVLNMYEYT